MFYKIAFLSLSLLSLMNCSSQNSNKNESSMKTIEEKNISGNIFINEGESVLLKESGITIKFLSISEDSRCPEGVTCVWAGVAIADLELSSKTEKAKPASIATMNWQAKNHSKNVLFENYSIELMEVTNPDKNISNKGKYKIGLSLRKLPENQTGELPLTEIKPTN